MKYYAVKKGKTTGIFTTWDECRENVEKYKGAIYKSFSSLDEAKMYLQEENEDIFISEPKEETFDKPTAYVDGSFDVRSGAYSFGAILFYQNQKLTFKRKFESDEYSFARNVAGEIRGASFIIQYAIKNNIKTLDLFYDYQGIESWYTGEWKANNMLTKRYQEFANNNKDKIKVNFVKVKSHTGVKYNEEVDLLAKEALGI